MQCLYSVCTVCDSSNNLFRFSKSLMCTNYQTSSKHITSPYIKKNWTTTDNLSDRDHRFLFATTLNLWVLAARIRGQFRCTPLSDRSGSGVHPLLAKWDISIVVGQSHIRNPWTTPIRMFIFSTSFVGKN